MHEDEKYKALFNKAGIKNTKHMENVMNILEKCERPLTAEDIYLKIKGDNSNISFSTVYRILDKLVLNKFVVKSAMFNNSRSVYELNRAGHKHYLVCLGCNKIVPINECPVQELERTIELKTGFMVKGHKLEMYGYCPECRKKIK